MFVVWLRITTIRFRGRANASRHCLDACISCANSPRPRIQSALAGVRALRLCQAISDLPQTFPACSGRGRGTWERRPRAALHPRRGARPCRRLGGDGAPQPARMPPENGSAPRWRRRRWATLRFVSPARNPASIAIGTPIPPRSEGCLLTERGASEKNCPEEYPNRPQQRIPRIEKL
jgi:hypothetical protein